MINNKFLSIFTCLILLFATSCKRNKITKTTIEPSDSVPVVVKQDSISSPIIPTPEKKVETQKKAEKILVKVEDVDFNYLKLKSKVNFKNESTDQSATASFHIKKDSAIWFSVSVSIVEAARGVITKDSIRFFAIDSKTFKRKYYELSLDSLSRQFNFDLDFGLLQSLLVGNMPIKNREIDSVSVADNGKIIHQIELPILIQNFILSENNKLKKLVAMPDSGTGKMTVVYDNFLIINDLQNKVQIFPQNDAVEISSQKDGQSKQTNVNLQHTKVEFLNENPGFVFKKK
jgi:Domain of unknown function (DUF4292)